MHTTSIGDLIQLVSTKDQKTFLLIIDQDDKLETHHGIIKHSDLIGQPYGDVVSSHLGAEFLVLTPSISSIARTIKRKSQIIFPKDLGLILLRLSIQPGQKVIEAGTGSGALTLTLAQAVGPHGMIYSYDIRADMQELAKQNLELVGMNKRVNLKTRDICDGFDEQNIPAIFLDIPNPWDYLAQVHNSLENGGFFGALVPTTNQVSTLLEALKQAPFGLLEVVEVMLRNYKTNPARLRPSDRMVAHTGYLIFARGLTQLK